MIYLLYFDIDRYSIQEDKIRTNLAPIPSPRLTRVNKPAVNKKENSNKSNEIEFEDSTPIRNSSQGNDLIFSSVFFLY